MTTSFANFTRGRIVESIRANIAGFLLALSCAVQIPWCWMSTYRGRLLWVERPDRMLVWLLATICGVSMVQWVMRVSFN